jgi:3-oxoacyl-[acyl-carrier protein] reductase
MRLDEKRAVVTGGARGIGSAIARLFAHEGARVAIADIDRQAGAATAADICAAGGKAAFFAADVSSDEDVRRLMSDAAEQFGGLDVLVNNAACWGGDGRILETGEQTWNGIIDGSLKSVFLCAKHALPRMIESGGGSMINISSINALRGIELTAYTTAKAGIIGLTRLLASHYGANNVRANVICPGSIETEGVRPEFERSPQLKRKLVGMTQIGRIGTPEDVAYCALYLASDESAFATGAVFVIDGGASAGIPSGYGSILENRAL